MLSSMHGGYARLGITSTPELNASTNGTAKTTRETFFCRQRPGVARNPLASDIQNAGRMVGVFKCTFMIEAAKSGLVPYIFLVNLRQELVIVTPGIGVLDKHRSRRKRI